MILLFVASAALLMAICVIFPVANNVDNNKDELLQHFQLIDREDVKRQLEKCKAFFDTIHDKEQFTRGNVGEAEEDAEANEKEEEKEAEGEGQTKGHKKKGQRRGKN